MIIKTLLVLAVSVLFVGCATTGLNSSLDKTQAEVTKTTGHVTAAITETAKIAPSLLSSAAELFKGAIDLIKSSITAGTNVRNIFSGTNAAVEATSPPIVAIEPERQALRDTLAKAEK